MNMKSSMHKVHNVAAQQYAQSILDVHSFHSDSLFVANLIGGNLSKKLPKLDISVISYRPPQDLSPIKIANWIFLFLLIYLGIVVVDKS